MPENVNLGPIWSLVWPPTPASEELSSPNWQQLEPSLLESSSPTVEEALDKANAACPIPSPLPNTSSISDLLASVIQATPEPWTPSPLPVLRSPPGSHFKEGVTEDILPEPVPKTSTVTTATVYSETTTAVPLQAQANGTTVQGAPAPWKQPIAQKCPRPEHTQKAP